MKKEQLEQMKNGKGFIAALDQSGGSTPKALKLYGIDESQYTNDAEMFALIHQMRTRIIKSPAFNSEKILGAILFEQTMDNLIDGKYTADYLWEEKHIIPFLKVDKGLLDIDSDGVQLMKPIQQFEIAQVIIDAGLVPIIEPEVDITIPDKSRAEAILRDEIRKHLDRLRDTSDVMLKLSLPTIDNFYKEFTKHPRVVRVVALSGGYPREKANEILAKNKGVIASFSRALTQGLSAQQTDTEFNQMLAETIEGIYEASVK